MKLSLPNNTHREFERSEFYEFFKTPRNIGNLISAESTLIQGDRKRTANESVVYYLKYIATSISLSILIILLAELNDPFWIIVWSIAPTLLSVWIANRLNRFTGECSFIGDNGFAIYKFETSLDNITESFEVNFDECSDLFTSSVIKKQNFSYVGTDFCFTWLNKNNQLYEVDDTYNNKDGNPDEYPFSYYFMEKAERQWTLYNLQKMDAELAVNGFLEFRIIGKSSGSWFNVPYIHLAPNSLTFFLDSKSITYEANDIKNIYAKNGTLHIEHSNFQKRFLFKNKGNTNEIPLSNLSNSKYFFKAMEILLGYQF